jgi:hypothetical protein
MMRMRPKMERMMRMRQRRIRRRCMEGGRRGRMER